MISPADATAAACYDVLVIGAGPAGLAAAAAAAEAGATVALIDGARVPGGQYWRNAAAPQRTDLHHELSTFATLVQRGDAAGVDRFALHHAQTAQPVPDGFVVRCAVGDEPRAARSVVTLRSTRLVVATGAYDRQLPFPGWDLPGVFTAGGVQALLKGHGVPVGRRVVVAGTGPFLLPVADGLLRSGVQVPCVLEANSPAGFLRHPRALLGASTKLVEGAAYAATMARTRTPYRRRHAVVAALGTDRLTGVRVARLDRAGRPLAGSERTVECDGLAVGWGFTPQLELALQLGCATSTGTDGSLVVEAGSDQRTSVDGVWAAGESTGIGGADLAVVEGEIAGRAAAGVVAPDRLATRRTALRRFADALHAVHPVPPFLLDRLPDDTLICRCEEVTAGEVREAVHEWGATDARTVKLFARPGMGWCQGRVCGYATAQFTARLCGRDVDPADLRSFAERPLAVPLPLRLLAEDDPGPD